MDNGSQDNKPKLPSHIAYSIEQGGDDKNHWHRIGAAWPNKDGSLSLKLNSLPVDGRVNLQIRDEVERLKTERQNMNEQFQKEHEIDQKP